MVPASFTALRISLLMFLTAFVTPFPLYLFLSPSRSSAASYIPVDAPDGTTAAPTLPSDKRTSALTVGFPLESSTS